MKNCKQMILFPVSFEGLMRGIENIRTITLEDLDIETLFSNAGNDITVSLKDQSGKLSVWYQVFMNKHKQLEIGYEATTYSIGFGEAIEENQELGDSQWVRLSPETAEYLYREGGIEAMNDISDCLVGNTA